jgi:replication fork protection complex subunit Tof1/Swi1
VAPPFKVFLKIRDIYVQASTLDLFKTILADQKSLPREQPYKDLINLINYILRQFFKALAEDSFLAVEVSHVVDWEFLN